MKLPSLLPSPPTLKSLLPKLPELPRVGLLTAKLQGVRGKGQGMYGTLTAGRNRQKAG